jgi:hypothetical protein
VNVAGQDGNAFSEVTLCFAIKRPEHFGDGFALRGVLELAFGARFMRGHQVSFRDEADSASSTVGP